MQGSALLRAGFGPEKRAIREVEGGETARRRNFDAAGLNAERVPVKSACDHQMEDEPQIVFKADANAFAEAADLENFLAGSGADGWGRGSKEKGANDAHGFERLAEYAGFEGFDVDGDIWKFRHAVSTVVLQLGTESIVQRRLLIEDGGKWLQGAHSQDWLRHAELRGAGPSQKVSHSGKHNRLWTQEKDE